MKAKYLTCCIDSTADEIIPMVDAAREITLATFRRRCDAAEWESAMGYSPAFPLAGDYHVRFYRSRFNGRACYYAVHSAIEYVFVLPTGGPCQSPGKSLYSEY